MNNFVRLAIGFASIGLAVGILRLVLAIVRPENFFPLIGFILLVAIAMPLGDTIIALAKDFATTPVSDDTEGAG